MAERRVAVFFYGSYMNLAVLEEAGLRPADVEVVCLPGFDITIGPLANLVPSDRHSVYGVLAWATHRELDRLYAHAREVLGGVYLPEAVMVERRDGSLRPALCYIAPAMTPAPADPAYVDRLLRPAREHGFPDWYLAKLESFRS